MTYVRCKSTKIKYLVIIWPTAYKSKRTIRFTEISLQKWVEFHNFHLISHNFVKYIILQNILETLILKTKMLISRIFRKNLLQCNFFWQFLHFVAAIASQCGNLFREINYLFFSTQFGKPRNYLLQKNFSVER